MRKKRSFPKRKIIKAIFFFLGLMICSYPLVSSIVEQKNLKDTVTTYQEQIESTHTSEFEDEMSLAREYNSILYQSKGKVIDQVSNSMLSAENYNQILNLTGNGIMGNVEIPKININLPIYHGTSDEVLANGVGHMEGTSLPVGGENTRTVLAGHTGLPNSKLFTRLDELEEGDLFYIKVCDEVLAYKVVGIEVIEPDEIDKLEIVPEKDLVTLLTCTPYGLNTHRLIVTGERVTYVEEEYQSIEAELTSSREIVFNVIPFVFVLLGVIDVLRGEKSRKKRRKRKGRTLQKK